MNKLLITGCLLATAIAAVAMPNKKELAAAQKLVEDVIAPDVKALNAGRKTVKDVADIQMKLAADAQSEAEKYLLLQSAFKLYSRGEEFDSAAKALTAITRDIKDVPPELITELVDKEFNRDMGLKAPKEIEAMVSRIADGGANVIDAKATVDGYTWSYRVNNGEAEIVAEKDGKFSCAVSPSPSGNVMIPETLGGVAVTRIGQCAFKDSKGMTSVKIPSTVKSFGSWGVFAGCSGLTSVVIPDGVKSIEECAFWGCSNLKSVTIPPSVTKISDAAFGCCGGLASLTIPPTVKELRTQVFFGCGALTSVTIPASVEKIGWAAFVYSGELKEINVDPQNKWFTSVDGALYTKDLTELVACPNALTSLTIHPSVKKLRAAAIISCGKLESLTIPEGVTDIGWQAIKDCGSLKAVTIPPTVKNISEIAFWNCTSLTSVTIPENVASIGARAFGHCGSLTSVTMRGERPSAPNDIFKESGKLKVIHVPANAKSWAGMTEWQGVPLVFDGVSQGQLPQTAKDAERLARLEQEKAQREAERAEQRAQLLAIQDELARVRRAKAVVKDSSPEVRAAVESILKGMIKVQGRDYWLSATEVTQEQWEPIMEFNLSQHKGAKLPVEMVSRDDCDVFLGKLNQTKEVRESQFEFGLPTGGEWLYAAQGGSGMADVCWIKPGVVGNVLDMAWVGENSSNQTHVVATKSANAFGFYDMKGNVWEWLFDPARERGVRRGHSFCEDAEKCSLHNWINTPRNRRYGDCGLRLAAHKRVAPRPLLGGLRRHDSVNNEQASSPRARRLQRQQEAQAAMQLQTTIDDYTWSYYVNNGEAEIVASVGGRTCAISPSPTGKVLIPSTLEGVSVRSIGGGAFFGCSGLKEVIIPPSVTSIGIQAFTGCSALTSVTLHECVTNISEMAFQGCSGLFSVTIPPAVKSLASQTFVHCGNLTVVTIPSSVTSIGDLAFCDCGELTSVTMLGERPSAPNNIFQDCGKLKLIHVPANCKSWAGMKEWQGIPLVFDAK